MASVHGCSSSSPHRWRAHVHLICPHDAGPGVKVASRTHIKFKRGNTVALKDIKSKPLRGKIQHEQKLQNKAIKDAKLIYEWLKPTETGYLEAEGLERTRQFKQREIVQVRALPFNWYKPLC